jgi:hypothetical protein
MRKKKKNAMSKIMPAGFGGLIRPVVPDLYFISVLIIDKWLKNSYYT